MKYPFEIPFREVEADLDGCVSAIFSSLESEFLVLPRGQGFVDYPVFEAGYEALKRATGGFRDMDCATVLEAALQAPMALIVLRTILGFTPSEWAYLATQRTGIAVSQSFVRGIDRTIRLKPTAPFKGTEVTRQRIRVLVDTACQLIRWPAPKVEADKIHRLDKADTRHGPASMARLADMGVPYAMLLYERFLGRPSAGHRDSVSELVGDALSGWTEFC